MGARVATVSTTAVRAVRRGTEHLGSASMADHRAACDRCRFCRVVQESPRRPLGGGAAPSVALEFGVGQSDRNWPPNLSGSYFGPLPVGKPTRIPRTSHAGASHITPVLSCNSQVHTSATGDRRAPG